MTNLPTYLYIIDFLTNIKILCIFIVIFLGILVSVQLYIFIFSYESQEKKELRRLKIALSLLSIFSIFTIALPSEKTMYSMLAIKATKEVTNNPEVNEIIKKVLKVINKKLDDNMKEGNENND